MKEVLFSRAMLKRCLAPCVHTSQHLNTSPSHASVNTSPSHAYSAGRLYVYVDPFVIVSLVSHVIDSGEGRLEGLLGRCGVERHRYRGMPLL